VLTVPRDGPGLIDLTKVELVDANGNSATYFSDGTFTTQPTDSAVPVGNHAFRIGRIAVFPRPAKDVSLYPASGSAQLSWSQAPLAGHRITIMPGNRVISGGPVAPTEVKRTLKVTGLQNGVQHTITVTPTSTAGDGGSSSATVTPRMTMKVFGAGDRNGDRRADLWATGFGLDPTSNDTWRLYAGAGGGAFGRTTHPTAIPATMSGFPGSTSNGPGDDRGALVLSGGDLMEPLLVGGYSRVGTGWQGFRTIDASSDFTSDRISDVMAVTTGGYLYRYTTTSTGKLSAGVRIGGGWGTFHAVFSPGDFNGDSRSDIIGVDFAGKMWLYPGNGRGGFSTRRQIGSGWAGFGSVLPLRDFSGDGKVDIGAITMDGKLLMYPGNGRGGFLAKSQIGTGWGAFL
jgi:hypothetical protein